MFSRSIFYPVFINIKILKIIILLKFEKLKNYYFKTLFSMKMHLIPKTNAI